MNEEIKSEWVTALRSGVYVQTTGLLRDERGYCCLGVLCDVMDKSRWVPADDGAYAYANEEKELPLEVAKAVNLGETDPSVTAFCRTCNGTGSDSHGICEECFGDGEAESVSTLAEANDEGYTFDQIADIIEAEL